LEKRRISGALVLDWRIPEGIQDQISVFPLVQMTASHVQHSISHTQFQQTPSRSCTLSEWIITPILAIYYLDFIYYKSINISTILLLKSGPRVDKGDLYAGELDIRRHEVDPLLVREDALAGGVLLLEDCLLHMGREGRLERIRVPPQRCGQVPLRVRVHGPGPGCRARRMRPPGSLWASSFPPRPSGSLSKLLFILMSCPLHLIWHALCSRYVSVDPSRHGGELEEEILPFGKRSEKRAFLRCLQPARRGARCFYIYFYQ